MNTQSPARRAVVTTLAVLGVLGVLAGVALLVLGDYLAGGLGIVTGTCGVIYERTRTRTTDHNPR